MILGDLTQLPSAVLHNGIIYFLPPGSKEATKRSYFDVVEARADYFELRLALADERIFSHTSKFQRAKLSTSNQP